MILLLSCQAWTAWYIEIFSCESIKLLNDGDSNTRKMNIFLWRFPTSREKTNKYHNESYEEYRKGSLCGTREKEGEPCIIRQVGFSHGKQICIHNRLFQIRSDNLDTCAISAQASPPPQLFNPVLWIGSASRWCGSGCGSGCGSRFNLSPWCGFRPDFSPWCGSETGSRS